MLCLSLCRGFLPASQEFDANQPIEPMPGLCTGRQGGQQGGQLLIEPVSGLCTGKDRMLKVR